MKVLFKPNTLIIKWLDKAMEVRRTGTGFVSDLAAYNTRIPAGHPEGYLEAFANIYRNAATCIQHILEGLRGMKFVDKAVESSSLPFSLTRPMKMHLLFWEKTLI